MENSIVFWNKIAELLESIGLPHISELQAIMIFAAAFLVLFFILWLIFRNARLWYWKTNIQIDTLKSIDGRLQSVEDKLTTNVVRLAAGTDADAVVREEPEDSTESAQKNAVKELASLIAVGKSGRIYTEEELELQIRD
jgi:hypothetical protein